MLTCVSEQGLRRLLLASLGLLVLAAFVFYDRQNSAGAIGGGIALPKLLWLASAILFWFVLPLLFLLDARVVAQACVLRRRTVPGCGRDLGHPALACVAPAVVGALQGVLCYTAL